MPVCMLPSMELRSRKRTVFCCLCLPTPGLSCCWSWASLRIAIASALLGAAVPTSSSVFHSPWVSALFLDPGISLFLRPQLQVEKSFVIFHPGFVCVLQQEDFWKERLRVFQLPQICQTLIHHCLLPCPVCPAGSCLLPSTPQEETEENSRQNTRLSEIPES